MFDLFERGPLMDEAGGGDGGGGVAVADASSDFSDGGAPDTGGDGEVHDAEFVDPENALVPAEKVDEPETALVKAGERVIQAGKLTSSGRAAIEAVRALDPKLAQEVTRALFTRDFFRQQFPGGKKEVAQLRQLAEQHGGEQGIASLRSDSQQLAAIDALYGAADPKFLDQITETPEGQASFTGLMTPAFQKFEKLAPEKFGYEIAKRFQHLMNTGGLPTMFATQAAILNRAGKAFAAGNHELAASFLAEIIDGHNSIHGVLNSIDQAASKPPADASRAANPAADDRQKAITQREQALQKQEWEFAVQAERRRTFSKTWDILVSSRKLTGDQEANVKGFYELRMTAKIRQWKNNATRFFSNGDKDGYLKEQYAFFQQAIPEALRQAIQQAIPAKPGPKAASGPVRLPVNGKATVDRNGAAIRVAKMPPTSELDAIRTTGDMLSANKAFTKDGRMVTWA